MTVKNGKKLNVYWLEKFKTIGKIERGKGENIKEKSAKIVEEKKIKKRGEIDRINKSGV